MNATQTDKAIARMIIKQEKYYTEETDVLISYIVELTDETRFQFMASKTESNKFIQFYNSLSESIAKQRRKGNRIAVFDKIEVEN